MQSRTAFGLLKVPELQRLSVTVEVLRVGVMIVGVISVGVMTVVVISRIEPKLLLSQNKLQRGFTQKASSLNTAFIVTQTTNHYR
jgi:phosphosulfolactate phosphohydrolase-like enzyme